MNDENQRGNGGFWIGIALGGLVGAAAAYFLTSEDKEKARKKLLAKGKVLLNSIEEFAQSAEEKVADKVEEAKEVVSDKVEEIRENLPETAEEAVASVQEAANQAIAKIVEVAEDAKEEAQDNFPKLQKSVKKFFFKKGKTLGK